MLTTNATELILLAVPASMHSLPLHENPHILQVGAAFEALRVCAIWNRNWFLFAVVISIGIIPASKVAVSIDLSRHKKQTHQHEPQFTVSRTSYGYIESPFPACTQTANVSTTLLKM